MLSADDKVLISLHNMGYSKSKIQKLMAIFPKLSNLRSELHSKMGEVMVALGESVANNLKLCLTDEYIEKTINNIINLGINVVTCLDDDFPSKLRDIPDPPILLYYKGELSIANSEHLIGVVGTRKPSSYGKDVCEKFVSTLSRAGVVTISGLAYGIDSIVANKTLEASGKTIAVLGGGLTKIYPSINEQIAKEIVQNGGLLLSEYKPTDSPTQYTFPERNRIISGLSDGVLIVEAGEHSGSLITATCALEQGKELFVVPGNITSFQSKGSNRLIYEIPHCVVIEPENILESLHIGTNKNDNLNVEKMTLQLTIAQQLVYDLLKVEDMHFDDLAEKLNMKPRELNVLLTDMEMMGVIKSQSGNYYGV